MRIMSIAEIRLNFNINEGKVTAKNRLIVCILHLNYSLRFFSINFGGNVTMNKDKFISPLIF